MKKWIFLTILIVLIAAGAASYKLTHKTSAPKSAANTKTTAAPAPTPPPQPEVQLDTANLHALINQQRVSAKIKPLTVSDKLVDSATAKCQDMLKKNYYTHSAPDGTPYTNFIKAQVPAFKLSGENLGAGYTDVNQLISDWMQSPQHKANILNAKFTTEGIASCGHSNQKPGIVVVVHFLQP
jgi:uncharacterized protein YkwD